MHAAETSKTHLLYLLLKERITSGAVAPDQRLPSEPALAAQYGLSRVTVRRALDGLAQEGLITRAAGAGTFVAPVAAQAPMVADLSNVLAHLVQMGRDTRVRLLAFSYGVPPAPVARALRLAPGERTQHSLRVRYLDDVPFSYLSTHVPERIGVTYSEADLATRPLLALLEQSGVAADKADQTISATLAGPEAAEALGVEVGSALLSMTRVVLDAEGRGIEHLAALYRPDKHAFHMELTRTGGGSARRWEPSSPAPTPPPKAAGAPAKTRRRQP